MITTIALLQFIIFMTYTGYIYYRFGVLGSISASTGVIEPEKRWYFLIFLWAIAILNLFQGMEGYGVVAAGGILFTGITIDHYTDRPNAKTTHYVAVTIGIIAIFLGFIMLHGLWIPTAILVAAGVLMKLFNIDNFIWWIEIVIMFLVTASYIAIGI